MSADDTHAKFQATVQQVEEVAAEVLPAPPSERRTEACRALWHNAHDLWLTFTLADCDALLYLPHVDRIGALLDATREALG